MARGEDLIFRAGDVSLAASLTLPDGDGPHPWAVLVPSWLPRRRDGGFDRLGHPTWFEVASSADPGILERLADALAERGVASLRYDPRGCGASPGTWSETDLFTRIDDVRDAVGAMRSRPELDLRRTALVGHGEGAGIVLSVAIGDPAVAAVGLIGPAARSWRDGLRRGAAERDRTGVDRGHPIVRALDRAAEELIERVDRGETRMSLELRDEVVELALAGWEQAFHTPSLALATMLHRSVVLLHAADDAWSDADESRILARVLADAGNEPHATIADVAGHDLVGADAELHRFADALAQRIEPRDLPPVLLAIEQMR